MIEYALEDLLAGSDTRRRGMVRRMCQRWPEQPALSIVFALTAAASTIDDNFSRDGGGDEVAPLAFRMAAIVAADVYAAESIGHSPAKARDLLHFWRRVDPYFMEP